LDAEVTIPRAKEETILVVDDDSDVRSTSVQMLEELGYRVIQAPDGASALRLLDADDTIKLLFTDVGLPGMNGRQLADEARRRRPKLKVLFTSGYARNAIVHHGRLDPGVELQAVHVRGFGSTDTSFLGRLVVVAREQGIHSARQNVFASLRMCWKTVRDLPLRDYTGSNISG
jgi:CheY-like chemotaxis protein